MDSGARQAWNLVWVPWILLVVGLPAGCLPTPSLLGSSSVQMEMRTTSASGRLVRIKCYNAGEVLTVMCLVGISTYQWSLLVTTIL